MLGIVTDILVCFSRGRNNGSHCQGRNGLPEGPWKAKRTDYTTAALPSSSNASPSNFRPQNDLCCVEWGVKLYALTHYMVAILGIFIHATFEDDERPFRVILFAWQRHTCVSSFIRTVHGSAAGETCTRDLPMTSPDARITRSRVYRSATTPLTCWARTAMHTWIVCRWIRARRIRARPSATSVYEWSLWCHWRSGWHTVRRPPTEDRTSIARLRTRTAQHSRPPAWRATLPSLSIPTVQQHNLQTQYPGSDYLS